MGALKLEDGDKFSIYSSSLSLGQSALPSFGDPTSLIEKPREAIYVASLEEHTKAVNELAVSQDQTFFGSASDDGTVKIWELRRIDRRISVRSSATYRKGGKCKCVTICDNTTSLAAGCDDGSVSILRVDILQGNGRNSAMVLKGGQQQSSQVKSTVRCTNVKTIKDEEGAVVAIRHCSTHTQSLLIYATQNGFIHGHDLRMRKEAWKVIYCVLHFCSQMANHIS
jgi:phosphoinositide-3-kinase regulatory subunit 4